jgi:hypothetical protein
MSVLEEERERGSYLLAEYLLGAICCLRVGERGTCSARRHRHRAVCHQHSLTQRAKADYRKGFY